MLEVREEVGQEACEMMPDYFKETLRNESVLILEHEPRTRRDLCVRHVRPVRCSVYMTIHNRMPEW